MPRIYTDTNDPIDFCQACWQLYAVTETAAKQAYHGGGVGPDNRGDCWGWDAEHPDYEGDEYECYECNRHLTWIDNNSDEPTIRGRASKMTQSEP